MISVSELFLRNLKLVKQNFHFFVKKQMVKKSIIPALIHLTQNNSDFVREFEINEELKQGNPHSITDFMNQAKTVAEKLNAHIELNSLDESEFELFLSEIHFPILILNAKSNLLEPILLRKVNQHLFELVTFENGSAHVLETIDSKQVLSRCKKIDSLVQLHELDSHSISHPGFKSNEANAVVFITGFTISDNTPHKTEKISPVKRFFKLVQAEKRDIYLIYFFAILVSLITLTIPLGIQAIIGLMSGGLLLESVMVLIFLVIAATMLSGWLQIQQLALVEILQQRIFTKTAFDFSYRIPRIKAESLTQFYTPELVNRFFDVLNVQKSLPKILIEFTSALIQIFFGLLLLSFYHPYFILFGLAVIGVVVIVFLITGKAGLDSSINESKYKYQLAFWLEEMGRAVQAFKLSAYTGYSVNKTDKLLNKYLYYRKQHFKVLVKQFTAIVAFKTLITAGLLILGGMLVFQKKINLGQFVASEIIILLVINSVEKIISNVSSVYDLLTAIDKVSTVSELPLERKQGRSVEEITAGKQFELQLNNVSFTYPQAKFKSIENLNIRISKGDKICICGYNDSGKTTLLKLIAGIYDTYNGTIAVNGVSVRDLDLISYRKLIADVGNPNEIFEGSIEENITMGNHFVSFKQIIEACEWADLNGFVMNLQDGLKSKIAPAAANLPSNIAKKILLARAYLSQPRLLLLDDFFHQVQRKDKIKILDSIFNQKEMAVVMITSQAEMLERSDYIYVMQSGTLVEQGTFQELQSRSALDFFTNQ